MSDQQAFKSRFGQLIYHQLLPEVYRNNDNQSVEKPQNHDELGDFAKYLDAFGELLDALHGTLEQRLNDVFPDTCQPWLLPYFADLLDVCLVSPEEEGKRREIDHAILWRQRKGTPMCVEEIAETIAQMEVEIQEGWKQVVVTPRINQREHPHAFVDPRKLSRAVQVDMTSPDARTTRFKDTVAVWHPINPEGTPCFPESYEDQSRRTVDLRSPEPQSSLRSCDAQNRSMRTTKGIYHPKRLALRVPVPSGFFAGDIPTVPWANVRDAIDTLQASGGMKVVEELIRVEVSPEQRITSIRSVRSDKQQILPVLITNRIELGETPDDEGNPELHEWVFENLILDNKITVHGGRVAFHQCAIRDVEIHTIDVMTPVLSATNSLIKTMRAARGLVRFEYVTLLKSSVIEALQATDSILLEPVWKDGTDKEIPASGCIRYSRVPAQWFKQWSDLSEPGLSVTKRTVSTERVEMFSIKFGEWGCGVLDPLTSKRICSGAEDGGEMGAYHHRLYCLKGRALLDKLADFLPVGIEPVLIFDERLNQLPPVVESQTEFLGGEG